MPVRHFRAIEINFRIFETIFCSTRFEIYNLQFKSDGSMKRLSIDGPNAGDWYAVAFISWTDPNNDRIEQQGKIFSFIPFYSVECWMIHAFTWLICSTHKSINPWMIFLCTCVTVHKIHTHIYTYIFASLLITVPTPDVFMSTTFCTILCTLLYTKANVLFLCRILIETLE